MVGAAFSCFRFFPFLGSYGYLLCSLHSFGDFGLMLMMILLLLLMPPPRLSPPPSPPLPPLEKVTLEIFLVSVIISKQVKR